MATTTQTTRSQALIDRLNTRMGYYTIPAQEGASTEADAAKLEEKTKNETMIRQCFPHVKQVLDTTDSVCAENDNFGNSHFYELMDTFRYIAQVIFEEQFEKIYQRLKLNEDRFDKIYNAFGLGLERIVDFITAIPHAFYKATCEKISADQLIELSHEIDPLIDANAGLHNSVDLQLFHYLEQQGSNQGYSSKLHRRIIYDPNSDTEKLYLNDKLLDDLEAAIKAGKALPWDRTNKQGSRLVTGCHGMQKITDNKSIVDICKEWVQKIFSGSFKEHIAEALDRTAISLIKREFEAEPNNPSKPA